MKKKLMALCALSSLLVASTGQAVFAADGGQVQTKGDITFEQDTSPVDPLNPIKPDPNNPVKPVDPDAPSGTEGPLSIDYVSNFHFGKQKISSEDKTYYAKLDVLKDSNGNSIEVPNFIQVTDKRGTNAGWKVQVRQEQQLTNTNNKELKGASISIKNGVVKTAASNKAKAPSQVSQEINLVPGENGGTGPSQDVVVAKQDEGMSTWINSFGTESNADKSIALKVPGASAKEKESTYTTNLTWILTDTPD